MSLKMNAPLHCVDDHIDASRSFSTDSCDTQSFEVRTQTIETVRRPVTTTAATSAVTKRRTMSCGHVFRCHVDTFLDFLRAQCLKSHRKAIRSLCTVSAAYPLAGSAHATYAHVTCAHRVTHARSTVSSCSFRVGVYDASFPRVEPSLVCVSTSTQES